MKRHLMVLITLLFVATSSWGAGFTGLDRIWMQDATGNGSANQYWGTVDAFLEANELDALGNPVWSTANLVGAGLSLGTAGTTAGNINFKSTVAARWMDLRAGAISTNYIWTLPLVASGGANFLLNVDVDGTMGYTNPSTLGGGYTNLTSFVDQTAWRVFYSNTAGDVTELALGADGTYLKSNGATSAPTFATPAGSGDMTAAVYDAAGITEQLVGLTATQTLTNKTLSLSDFVAGTGTNNTLGAFTRTATNPRMGTGAAVVNIPLIDTTDTLTNKTMAAGSNVFSGFPYEICVAASDETTDLATGTTNVTFRAPRAFTLTDVRASLSTVATGATLVGVDINEAGTSVMTTTKITIDASESTSTTAATAPVITDSAIADDALMTVDIDAVGNTTAGKGLKVCLIGTIDI